jgi:hypothetical protein
MTPDPSLAGVRLVIADHVVGFPVLRALPLCTCCRHYPGAAVGCLVCSLPQPCQPSPIWLSGRPARRPFRGLLGVHSRYGLHTHAATNSWHASPKASTVSLPPQLLRSLPAGAIAGWDFHPLGSAAFPRRTPTPVGQDAGCAPKSGRSRQTVVWEHVPCGCPNPNPDGDAGRSLQCLHEYVGRRNLFAAA